MPAPGHPPPGEGPGRDLRRRARRALLLHRHRRRPAGAGDQRGRRADEQERRRRRLHRRPAQDPDARKLDQVTYGEALRRGLKVVDATAFSLCMDNGLPMIVFGMEGEGNVARAVRGERIGTLVTAGYHPRRAVGRPALSPARRRSDGDRRDPPRGRGEDGQGGRRRQGGLRRASAPAGRTRRCSARSSSTTTARPTPLQQLASFQTPEAAHGDHHAVRRGARWAPSRRPSATPTSG